MARFLTDEWFARQQELFAALPERSGASARLQHVVDGGPDGTVRYREVIEDGRLVDSGLGELDDPDVTLSEQWDDAVRTARGELRFNTAFMQGRVKVVGDMARLMAVLPLRMTPEHQAAQAALGADTEA